MAGSDRFQVLTIPQALPGKCVTCGYVGGDERKFVDFGFDVDFYGAVYFCTGCFVAAAKAFDYVSPEVHQGKLDELQAVNQILQRLEAENAKLRGALALLDFLGTNSIPDKPTRKSAKNKRQDDNRSDESPDVERPDDVPTIDGDKSDIGPGTETESDEDAEFKFAL